MLHFLHGVSPDAEELAFVGLELRHDGLPPLANIFSLPAAGGAVTQLTTGDRPADGPDYSPDGEWIYFNTEAFSTAPGHAQIARMRRDGSDLTQLTFDDRVNWFPHPAPAGDSVCYLSYPPGTQSHPPDLDVELRLVADGNWNSPRTVARLVGGQGTINVNSWAPDSSAFAYVSYPVEGRPGSS
jgi:Tol biopolymer transport system component